jgi:predicted  nucleic acid-binding Zn-ribbon protein
MRSEKVERKQQEIEEKNRCIEQLSQEITELHNRTAALLQEIRETEEKISVNSAGYLHASEHMKDRIAGDIQRIKQHVM